MNPLAIARQGIGYEPLLIARLGFGETETAPEIEIRFGGQAGPTIRKRRDNDDDVLIFLL